MDEREEQKNNEPPIRVKERDGEEGNNLEP